MKVALFSVLALILSGRVATAAGCDRAGANAKLSELVSEVMSRSESSSFTLIDAREDQDEYDFAYILTDAKLVGDHPVSVPGESQSAFISIEKSNCESVSMNWGDGSPLIFMPEDAKEMSR